MTHPMTLFAPRPTTRFSSGRVIAVLVSLLVALLAALPGVAESEKEIPRRPDGRPDLSGTYDTATLTPLERPVEYGDKRSLSDDEARRIGREEYERRLLRNLASEPDREAPPEGGDGSSGAAGNVGGYNTFWIDRGDGPFELDGEWRTSILVDPPNGRLPPLSEAGRQRAARSAPFRHGNTGTAWWLDLEVGPYDDPELRPLQERCLLSRTRSGPPILSALYNNLKRIIQTDDHVVIVAEQIHDARIVRLDADPGPNDLPRWLGDSVGHWEGDTLVVETTHFLEVPTAPRGAVQGLSAVERFTRLDDRRLLYQFTIDDPSYQAPYSGESVWPATDERVYEYACHEGNYSFHGILGGARALEQEATEEPSSP